MIEFKTLNRALLVGVAGLALSACGGGGSDGSAPPPSSNNPPPSSNNPPPTNNPPPAATNTFSGVAAVGAPLVGNVTVKDSLGATKTVPIGTNGSYSVDVTGMTAPFLFRAAGIANGREYIVHSAAAAADVNGTINVTQLTDLVVNNIAGQIASSYFDSGNFASVSKDALDAEAAKLKEKLLPVLQALGVDASVDLLRTQFTPLESSLDSALDILRVSVDATSLVATITNIVTQQQIQDDLKVAAAAEASPAQLTDTTGVSEGADDVALIKKALADFAALFATSLPPAATIETALSSNFRLEDRDAATFAAEMESDTSSVGVTFTDVDIKKIDYTDATNVFAIVDFTAKDPEGREMDRIRAFQLVKDANGKWRLHGDRRILEMRAMPLMIRSVSAQGTCVSTGIEFYMEDFDPSNNGALAIDHIKVYGPGLPPAGVRYAKPDLGGWWQIEGDAGNVYRMAGGCAGQPSQQQPVTDTAISAIPDGAVYLAVAYDNSGNRIDLPGGIQSPETFADGAYALGIDKRPLTLAEVQASNAFPAITSPASPAALASYAGGDLSIVASGMNPKMYSDVYLTVGLAGGGQLDVDDYTNVSSEGVLNTTLSLVVPQNDSVSWRSLRVLSNDSYRRLFMTIYN